LRSKTISLALLAVLSFVGPFLETLLTGSVEPFGKWEIGETLLALVLVFWWYHVDKAERGYKAGPLMNGGMLLVMALAMPIYLVRSRGWQRGAIATAVAIGLFLVLLGLGELGEWCAKKMGPP
jgi:drug/metabolite transporter (DMT)-like permease